MSSSNCCFLTCIQISQEAGQESESEVAQFCPTLFEPVDCSLPGSSVHEILQGLPFPSPGDLPDLGIQPRSPALQTDALTSEPPGRQFRWPGIPIS